MSHYDDTLPPFRDIFPLHGDPSEGGAAVYGDHTGKQLSCVAHLGMRETKEFWDPLGVAADAWVDVKCIQES